MSTEQEQQIEFLRKELAKANAQLLEKERLLVENKRLLAEKDAELERVRKAKIAELKAEQLALVVSKEINDELFAKMKKESDHEDLSDALKTALTALIVHVVQQQLEVDNIKGLAAYLLKKGSEKTTKEFKATVKAGKKLEKENRDSNARLAKAIGATLRSIETNQKKANSVTDALNQGLSSLSEKESNSPILQAQMAISRHQEPEPIPKVETESAGRKKLQSKEVGDQREPSINAHWCCTQCGDTNSVEANTVQTYSEFMHSIFEGLETLLMKDACERRIVRCPKCGRLHVEMASRVESYPASPCPSSQVSIGLVTSAAAMSALGIPMNRIMTLLGQCEEMQLGKNTIAQAVHRTFSPSGAFGRLLGEIISVAQQQDWPVDVDGTPIDVLQTIRTSEEARKRQAEQGDDAKEKIHIPTKQNYFLAITTVPGAKYPVTNFNLIKGRGTDAIKQILSDWHFSAFASDAYGGYKSILDKMGRTQCGHQSCLVHFRRELLACCNIPELARLVNSDGAQEILKERLTSNAAEYIISSAIDAMRKIYMYEHQNKRQAGESLDDWLGRVKKCRDLHQRPLMDALDTLMVHLAKTHAVKVGNVWKQSSVGEISKAVVYYMNNRQELRYFLDDPKMPPDTNEVERCIRDIALYKHTSFFKQSEEYASSYAAVLSLRQTAAKNGIDNFVKYLLDFYGAYFRHCLDYSINHRAHELNDPSTYRINSFDKDADKDFDFEPWLPWNYKPIS